MKKKIASSLIPFSEDWWFEVGNKAYVNKMEKLSEYCMLRFIKCRFKK